MKQETKVDRWVKRVELTVRRAFLGYLAFSRRWKVGSRSQAEQAARRVLPKLLAGSPTILFLRQDRLGDAIVTTPLLVALKAAYPSSKLIMLLGTNNQGIAPLLPVECETVIFKKNPIEDRNMLRKLRTRGIDILIDLTDNASATSSILIRRIRPKVAIGIEKSNAVIYDIVVPRLDPSITHISRRIAELLRPLHIDPERIDLKPKLKLPKQRAVQGRIGINVSAGSGSRYAPAAAYASIAAQIAEGRGVSEVRILAAPEELAFAAEVMGIARHPRVLAQESAMSFAEFGAYIGTCSILITPDTSIVHLGAAVGVPMVVIFAPIPAGLRYWTPTGVDFEMMVQSPSLATLEPEPVVALFRKLQLRLLA